MSNWKKYNSKFIKDKNTQLESLGIECDNEYEYDMIRIDMDMVSAYNVSDQNNFVSLWFKDGRSAMVEVDIKELDDYFFE